MREKIRINCETVKKEADVVLFQVHEQAMSVCDSINFKV